MAHGHLEGQTPLTGPVGERLHAPVVLEAAAVEHARGNAGLLRALREHLAGPRRLLHRLQTLEIRLHPRHGRDRLALRVVDQLCEHAPVGAVDGQARALLRPFDLAADPAAALGTALVLLDQGPPAHARLPTLRATYSPAYRTPLPL